MQDFYNFVKCFHESFTKEVGTGLFQAKNAIERLIKTYLNRLIELLYFLPVGDFRNVIHNCEIFLHFQQQATCKLGHGFNIGFSLTCGSYSCYSFMVKLINAKTI